MSDLYGNTKKLVTSVLKEEGFRADSLGEGLYKKIEDDISITIQISGMWSHVESFVGIRFAQINDRLQMAAKNSGWKPVKVDMFKLNLLGLFREKVGDYCDSAESLGVYCPSYSTIANSKDILKAVHDRIKKVEALAEIGAALHYAQANNLILPFGIYTIPAGAQITSDARLWDWCAEHVSPHVPAPDRADYERLLCSLKEQ